MPLSKHELETALAHLARGDWQAAHEIVQKDEASSLSCWLHAIVHLMEGDEVNARYWYGAAKRPFPDRVDIAAEIKAARAELRP